MTRAGKIVAAAALLPLLLCGPVRGKVLYDDVFSDLTVPRPGKTVDTARGKGWQSGLAGTVEDQVAYLKFPVAEALSAKEGTIEMELVRGEQDEIEGLFFLMDDTGKILFSAMVDWDGRTQDRYPELKFSAHADVGGQVWYRTYTKKYMSWDNKRVTATKDFRTETVLLDETISRGASFHLAFTWGPSAGKCAVYLNGRKLDAEVDVPFGMTGAVEKASWLVVGAEPILLSGGFSYLSSTLEYVRTYDSVESGLQLSKDPQRYASQTGQAPAVASLGHDAARVAGFSGKLVAGDTVTVSMEGTPGASATFDVAPRSDLRGEILLDWRGWGVYLEDKAFFDEGEINLRDVEEYRVYVSTDRIGAITEETEFAEALEVEEQSYLVDGLLPDTPYYIAVMALMDDDTFRPVLWPDQGLPMAEVEGAPGSYTGTFTVDYRDRYPEAVIVGRLGGTEVPEVLVGDETFEVDPSLTLTVSTSPSELKADEESTSEISVTVTDANDDPVPGHEVRFVLATTSLYTGVVGGGEFASEVGGGLSRDFWGETDLFGQVTAQYTAGFAAKTAIIVARDMQSNDTGAGYVKTYINAVAQLELEAVQEVAGKALGYSITVTSSDEWLTADGESEARITALVTQDGIPVEGHRVGFTVTSGAGKIRTVRGETGRDGKARAVYTAGTKIGTVLIRAIDHTVGITGTVQIELRSDAPAKIAITLDPELLPADGRSRAEVAVVVTDINDNPNEGVEVEYAVSIGSGRLRDVEPVTDRDGESTAEYVAGRLPGKVSIEVTVRSTVPTEEELSAARDLAVSVLDYDFF